LGKKKKTEKVAKHAKEDDYTQENASDEGQRESEPISLH